ncbi:hypothetical protein BU15DRAFT_87654 [Melanogaster broomeanus]|nr:hypothetical protein BU15DRAFT_87654 [Melanogaster broomeanus]
MWKNSLVAQLHHRTVSLKAQGTPLIPLKGPELFDIPLDSLPDRRFDDNAVLADDNRATVLESTNSSNPVYSGMSTTTDEKSTQPAVHTSPAQEARDLESNESKMRNIRKFLMEEIDGAHASAPLTAYCFMTGFIDAVCFSAIFVWCAFQTGQYSAARVGNSPPFRWSWNDEFSFHLADQQALCSVITFIFGAFLGRIGDKMGCKTRAWMFLGTFIQTVFTMIAAIMIWQSGQGSLASDRADPAWSNAFSFACVIMGKRMNTQFTTTVVLTTTCSVILVASRDHKVMAITSLFLGGFLGRAILDVLGSAGTLGVGTGIRFLIALSWFFVPEKKSRS